MFVTTQQTVIHLEAGRIKDMLKKLGLIFADLKNKNSIARNIDLRFKNVPVR